MLVFLALATGVAHDTTLCNAGRRAICLAAASALPAVFLPSLPAHAAYAEATMELIEEVGVLSLSVKSLQYEVRETAPVASSGTLRKQLVGQRPMLQVLAESMANVAPQLRICAPEAAGCDCTPDPVLMRAAAAQVDTVQTQLVALDAALASGPKGFESLELGALSYPAGRVERALEELSEATDLFLDLAAGRPPMTARLGPISAPRAPSLLPPPIRAAGISRAAAELL